MKAWLVPVSGEITEITVSDNDRVLIDVSKKYFDGVTLDLTRVKWDGKFRNMAVDDEGLCKDLPINERATQAYWGACRPGTTHPIAGLAVIFEGLLP